MTAEYTGYQRNNTVASNVEIIVWPVFDVKLPHSGVQFSELHVFYWSQDLSALLLRKNLSAEKSMFAKHECGFTIHRFQSLDKKSS